MAQHVEPMEVDCMDSDFENKENSYHHNNAFPCTEKGYEELDVSELNMKLRYSITPAASPMSKSYTAYVDNRNLDTDDSLNCNNENANLTRSLNSSMTKNDSVIKSLKTLPLQTISTEPIVDNRSSVLRQLDSTITGVDNNVTVTVTDIDENLSLPSSTSSAIHTPEATTPTNITKNDEGSPIIRGLKSVFNMFRSSQSPIPPVENDNSVKQEVSSLDKTYCEDQTPQTLASTPISVYRSRDGSTSKRSSPLKDSIAFSDDLEKELQWKDETVLFSEEKIPIHKLFMPLTKPTPIISTQKDNKPEVENLNATVEYMDVSFNNSMVLDNTVTNMQNNTNAVDSDGEFVDCETTFTKNQSQNVDGNIEILKDPLSDALEILDSTKKIENEPEVKYSVEEIVNEKDLQRLDITRDIVNENILSANENNQSREIVTKPITDDDKPLDVTRGIVIEDITAANETGECCETESMPLNNADIPLDLTGDIVKNMNDLQKAHVIGALNATEKSGETVHENVPDNNENLDSSEVFYTQKDSSGITSYNNDKNIEMIVDKDSGIPEAFTSETKSAAVKENSPDINENLDHSEVIYNQKDSSGMISYNNDKNIEIVLDKDSSVPETIMTPDAESTEVNIYTPLKSAEMSNEIRLDQKIEYIAKNDAPHDQILPCSDNDADVEKLLHETDIIESENVATTTTTCEDIKTEVHEDPVTEIETKTTDIIENLNTTLDLKKDMKSESTAQDLAKHPLGEEADELVKATPESCIQMVERTVLSIDVADTTEFNNEDLLTTNNFLVDEPANIPLPDDNDFDIDMTTPTNDKVETIQVIPPDVLDATATESKLDAKESLDIALDKINTVQIDLDTLNETHDIVNSLTEIIGESQNNTVSEHMLDQSQRAEPMDVIKYENDTQALPDLVNQSIHNITIEEEFVPELNNQPDASTESVEKAHEDKLSDLNEKSISSSETVDAIVIKNTTIQSNESFNLNKEHTDAIVVPTKNIDEMQETNQTNSINNEVHENTLKEIKDFDGISDSDLKAINENPNIDEVLVLSGNNSPYVSVIAETESKSAEESFEKIDIPLYTTNAAPSSPPIRSKGYNFNFDEMDDPFATKTKIRLSPPSTPSKLETHDGEIQNKSEAKKVPPNRRRSQPPERKRPTLNKKKFNTTFDAGSTNNNSSNKSDSQNSEGDSKNVTVDIIKDTTATIDTNDAADNEVANILDSTQLLDKIVEKSLEIDPTNVTLATDSATELNSTESMTAKTTSDIKISSSEQSTYYSAAGSSTDSSISKNVFNLPEIDDKNFNPFATMSKMRRSPPPDPEIENPFATKSKMRSSPDSSIVGLTNERSTLLVSQKTSKLDAEDKMDTELMEKDTSYNISNTTQGSSTKSTEDKNITQLEVNTEDEDTEEGPFLEAEDAIDKLLDIDNDNMMQFDEIPAHTNEENIDGGELFIDAEAFEFLLNQNKSNVVADSGKESLFLKFDPLFAKRISSDGVLAALNQVQKRQSTPTKPTRPSLRNEASPIAGPSTVNVSYEEETNVTQDSIDDLNVTVAKPTMAVTPAVNPGVTPRNKTTTPPRSNRRSITFTSPAMAVIDRLLSLSGNNSYMGHDSTVTQANREHAEADVALIQLRELLAEKEISVYQLRSESKELKDRLLTMETQVKILETDGQERLNKINELNNRLAEKTKVNKSMAAVVEEYERTIASLIAETEQDKKRHTEERIRLINERDEQTAHLASMEVSFSDLHSKYEKSKQLILSCKANEETCKKSIKNFEENITKMQTNYEMLKQHATSKLNHANQELQKITKAHESEVLKLNALIKRKDMHITSLEETLAQKTKANEELTAICDELINKVG